MTQEENINDIVSRINDEFRTRIEMQNYEKLDLTKHMGYRLECEHVATASFERILKDPGVYVNALVESFDDQYSAGTAKFCEVYASAMPTLIQDGLNFYWCAQEIIHRTTPLKPVDTISTICKCGISRVDCEYHR